MKSRMAIRSSAIIILIISSSFVGMITLPPSSLPSPLSSSSISPLSSFPLSLSPSASLFASGENQLPVAVSGNHTEEEPGKMVFFSALGSYDPDGEIILYEWDFQGDGVYDWNSSDSGNTEHSYEDEGVYNATLRVTDDNSTSSIDVHYVFILEKDDNGETDLDLIIALLTVVGIMEIIAGICIFAVILYLRRKLYDTL